MLPTPLQKLIDSFSKFPTVGPRTASRFVFYLIKLPEQELENFLNVIKNLKKSIKICSFCFNPFDASGPGELCPICSNPGRDKSLLCLVEKETDLISIENIKRYKGLYFILGGTLPAFKKSASEKIRIEELEERIKNPAKFNINNSGFKEIIIATNPTTEGEVTALFIERKLKEIQVPEGKEMPRISRLGRGLPIGGELEYADEETLGSALEGRK